MNQYQNRTNTLIGRYIRKIRKSQGFTGAEIGKMLHISQQQVSRYERGLNAVPLYVLLMYLDKLNVSPESFFLYFLDEWSDHFKCKSELKSNDES